MTRKQAILLLFAGVISKMAHADEKGNLPTYPFASSSGVRVFDPQPMGISINLDSFTGITATMGGETITVTSADLFKALKER